MENRRPGLAVIAVPNVPAIVAASYRLFPRAECYALALTGIVGGNRILYKNERET